MKPALVLLAVFLFGLACFLAGYALGLREMREICRWALEELMS